MIRVLNIYPADPLGKIPGGIDTLIRDFIRFAPPDFRYSLIGATTDSCARPTGQWTRCRLDDKEFDFFPTYEISKLGVRQRIPATVKHLWPLIWRKKMHQADILESHRVEPFLIFSDRKIPRFAFIHQDMTNLASPGSDIMWRHAPGIYKKIEDAVIPGLTGVFCVHEEAVKNYRDRFPEIADRIQFMPTWTNPDLFFMASADARASARRQLKEQLRISKEAKLLVSVGRLDQQKNPLRLLAAIAELVKRGSSLHLLMVGEGRLRKTIEPRISELGLQRHVTLVGIMPNHEVAELLRCCDLLVLSSDYEGMPVCAIEALACGVPVASTPVGEVAKVLKCGLNGVIAAGFENHHLVDAIETCLTRLPEMSGTVCVDAVRRYNPREVLQPVFDAYRVAVG